MKAIEVILKDPSIGPMIQCLDLSQNAGLEDAELVFLSQMLINLNKLNTGTFVTLKHINLSQIGASTSALTNFIKGLPQMIRLNSLDLSGNIIAFICADTLVNALKTIEGMPSAHGRHFSIIPLSPSQLSSSEDESHLTKLNLSGCKLDELTAY